MAAWTVVGSAVVGVSAALIARPGFSFGDFFLGIFLLVCGRVMGEMGLVSFIERASGAGKVVWEALVITRFGGWIGRLMATSKAFSFITSVAFFLVVIFSSEKLAVDGFSPSAAAMCFAAGAVYIAWHAIAEQLGKRYAVMLSSSAASVS